MLKFIDYIRVRDVELFESLLREGVICDDDLGESWRGAAYGAALPAALALGGGVAKLAGMVGGPEKAPAVSSVGAAGATGGKVSGEPKLLASPVSVPSVSSAVSIPSAEKEIAQIILDKFFKPEDIMARGFLVPSKIIRLAQDDPAKWDRDFANLKKPDVDIGMSTHGENFDKPVQLFVVSKAALRELTQDNTEAFYMERGRFIVMPPEMFVSLPTGNNGGVLNEKGLRIAAHELRHSTQNRKAKPEERNQGMYKDLADKKLKAKYYMNDPAEMGVRLAAIKNFMSPATLQSIAKSVVGQFDKNPKTRGVVEDFLQAFINLGDGNEMKLLVNLLSKNGFAEWVKSEEGRAVLSKYSDMSSEKMEQLARAVLTVFREELGKRSEDVESLIYHFNSLSDEERSEYGAELLKYYDTVVMRDNLSKRYQKIRGNA